MMRALVTGGGGFLGGAIVEQLLRRGVAVRSLSRGNYARLQALGVETIQADLCDLSAVERACVGCDVVFHVAARAGVWGSYETYHLPNVVGTQNVISACRKADVGRLVYTSSPSVVFNGSDMEGADESAPYPARYHAHYSTTKAEAERLVLAASCDTLQTIALRPHLIWGPRDSHIVPRILAQGREGKLRRIGPDNKKVDTTYIDNAAAAHLLADQALQHDSGITGRPYFISQGDPRSIWEIINGILAAADLPPIRKSVPRWLAVSAAGLCEAAHVILRRPGEPYMTRFVARELASSHWFDISAAKKELGYVPRVSIAEGLRRLEAWLKSSGSADSVADGADS